jgi:hypothetical protein
LVGCERYYQISSFVDKHRLLNRKTTNPFDHITKTLFLSSMRILSTSLFVLLSLVGFTQAKTYDFPSPVDTKTRPVTIQEKRVYSVTANISADNQFKGARLNAISENSEGTLVITISPENQPINPSPWYAFRLWSKGEEENRMVRITYPEKVKHRYWPKYSTDGEAWVDMEADMVTLASDTSYVELNLTIPTDTIWIAAQPIIHSGHVSDWAKKLDESKYVKRSSAGKSTGGRDLPFLLISNGSLKGKDIIVCFSRQHPPEVTGFLALQGFLSKLIEPSALTDDFFDKYALLVYPLMNPDGVDEGHWRHNLGGIDLNRDWAYYHQLETRTVANHIVKQVKKSKGKIVLGLDFHSTWYDVYYTSDRNMDVLNVDFTDKWLDYIKSQVPDYAPHDAPSGVSTPTTKGWINTQFKAVSVTYEIGDNTPPEFIKIKSEAAAEGMMKVLLGRQ